MPCQTGQTGPAYGPSPTFSRYSASSAKASSSAVGVAQRGRSRRPSAGRATCAGRSRASRRARGPRRARRARRRGRRGRAVGAVDVQPDAVLGADVGERVERIDGAGARRARRRRPRRPGSRRRRRSVSIARASSSGRMRKASSQRIGRSARRPRPSTSQARRDRVVRLLGGVDGGRAGRDAVLARGRQRPCARAGQAGQVGERAAAREVADRRPGSRSARPASARPRPRPPRPRRRRRRGWRRARPRARRRRRPPRAPSRR